MAFYKQSTAYTRMFKMIDSADHFSKKAGLTCTVNISKAGAAFGAAAGTVTEVANGWYKVALSTVDTNTLGDLAFYITAAGGDDTDFVDQIVIRDLADLAYPTVSGRSLDVSAGGEAGVDWANIGTPTTAVNLSGTTVGVVTDLADGSIDAAALAANTITAAKIASAAISAAKFAADAIDANALAADAVTEIWAKACTEPTAVVAASPTVIAALSWLLTLARNRITQTSTTQTLKADDTSTTIATSAVSDDGTTFTRDEWA